MELTGAIQESLLAVLCYDKDGKNARVVQSLIPTNSFDPFYKELAEATYQYLDRYRKPPREHTLDLILALKERSPDKAEMFDRVYRSLAKTKSGINHKFVLDRATLFRRYQRCRGVMGKALEVLEKGADGCVDECEALLTGVGKPVDGINLFDPGIMLNDPSQALSFLDDEDTDAFRCGIPEFDKTGIGPARGTTTLFMAPSNRGKSWYGIHQGKHALLDRARVLHITLEMNKKKVAQRYIQSFFSVTRREAASIITQHFERDELGRFTGLERVKLKNRPNFQQDDIRSVLARKMEKVLIRKPKLIIQEFPSGQLTTQRFEAYLDLLENTERFIPDVVIFDYADLMKLDPKNFRLETGSTHVRLRGIAQERNYAFVTMSQSNRSGYDAKVLKEKHVSEDLVKINNADVVLTYNQTDQELEMGLARLVSLKVRDEQKHQKVLISQSYAIGQFCIDSILMQERTYKEVMDEIADQDEPEKEEE